MAAPDSSKPTTTAPKLPDLSGETIAVQAGYKIIYVHKGLISSSSKFFKNATKPEWRTDAKPIDLSDEKHIIFEQYCQWLYTGKIGLTDSEEHGISGRLVQMYVLGGKIFDQAFQTAIIKAIIARMGLLDKRPSLTAIKTVYKGTVRGDPLRRLFVDTWALDMSYSWLGSERILEPTYKPFFDELLPALLDKRGAPDRSHDRPWISQPSSYYPKTVVLESGLEEHKTDEAVAETAGQDEMDVSEA